MEHVFRPNTASAPESDSCGIIFPIATFKSIKLDINIKMIIAYLFTFLSKVLQSHTTVNNSRTAALERSVVKSTQGIISSSQSLYLGGRQGIADDVAAIPFHYSLSSAALRESPNHIPIHSLMLSSHLFFCLPLLLAPFTVHCRICHARGSWDEIMWPYHLSFRFFTMVRRSSVMHSNCILESVANLLVRHMVFVANIKKSPIASHLKCLDPSLHFCCQGSVLTSR